MSSYDMTNIDTVTPTKEDYMNQLGSDLQDVLKTSGLWLLLRKSDKEEFARKLTKLSNEFVERAIE